ncbi:MAG: rhodanese-like domain-containing protein [Segetibacter sp.]
MKEQIANRSIIDVRTPEEFSQGHFPDAINIPLDQVPQRLPEFRDMPKPIVAYCRTGNRSGMAVSILKQNGIAEAVNGGGLDDMLQQSK